MDKLQDLGFNNIKVISQAHSFGYELIDSVAKVSRLLENINNHKLNVKLHNVAKNAYWGGVYDQWAAERIDDLLES